MSKTCAVGLMAESNVLNNINKIFLKYFQCAGLMKGFLAANFTVELGAKRQPRSGLPVVRMKASVLCLA